MYGLYQSHREELRSKRPIRLFVEERIVEVGELFVATLNFFADKADRAISFVPYLIKLLRQNKKHAIVSLGVALFLALMMLT